MKSINLQLRKREGNFLRNTIKKRTKKDLKKHEDKIKEQLNSGKVVDQKFWTS